MTEAPFVGTEIRQEPIQSVVLVTEIQAAECFYFATHRVYKMTPSTNKAVGKVSLQNVFM